MSQRCKFHLVPNIYRLLTTDYRLLTTDYRLLTIDYRLLTNYFIFVSICVHSWFRNLYQSREICRLKLIYLYSYIRVYLNYICDSSC